MRQFVTATSLAGSAAAQGSGFLGQYGELDLIGGENTVVGRLFAERPHMQSAAPHAAKALRNLAAATASTAESEKKNDVTERQSARDIDEAKKSYDSSGKSGYKLRPSDPFKNKDEYYNAVVLLDDWKTTVGDAEAQEQAQAAKRRKELSLRQAQLDEAESNLAAREKAVQEQMSHIEALEKAKQQKQRLLSNEEEGEVSSISEETNINQDDDFDEQLAQENKMKHINLRAEKKSSQKMRRSLDLVNFGTNIISGSGPDDFSSSINQIGALTARLGSGSLLPQSQQYVHKNTAASSVKNHAGGKAKEDADAENEEGQQEEVEVEDLDAGKQEDQNDAEEEDGEEEDEGQQNDGENVAEVDQEDDDADENGIEEDDQEINEADDDQTTDDLLDDIPDRYVPASAVADAISDMGDDGDDDTLQQAVKDAAGGDLINHERMSAGAIPNMVSSSTGQTANVEKRIKKHVDERLARDTSSFEEESGEDMNAHTHMVFVLDSASESIVNEDLNAAQRRRELSPSQYCSTLNTFLEVAPSRAITNEGSKLARDHIMFQLADLGFHVLAQPITEGVEPEISNMGLTNILASRFRKGE